MGSDNYFSISNLENHVIRLIPVADSGDIKEIINIIFDNVIYTFYFKRKKKTIRWYKQIDIL